MCTIIAILIVIVLIIICRMPPHIKEEKTSLIAMPTDSFTDIKGSKIRGAGLTPLTTPARKACLQLSLPNSQETFSPHSHNL